MSINQTYLFSGALLALTVTSGTLLASTTVSADEAIIDTLNVNIATACTLSGTGNTSHSTTVTPNTYEADIGTTTLKALCNDANGFSIYAAGYTGSKVGDTNSNKLVGQNTNATIVTGLATSGDTSNWAMKLSTNPSATYPISILSAPNTSGGADASFSAYHTVPNEYTKVATRTAGTDAGESAIGSELTTTYATFISAGQVGDTYSGKVIYVLVHPNNAPAPVAPLLPSACPAQSICYAPNSSDIDGSMSSLGAVTGSDKAGKVSSIGTNTTTELIAPNFSREGYGFAGWSTEFDAANATDPVIFGPNQTITTSTSGTGDADVSQHGLILYPVWIASAGNLQGWTGCSSLTAASYNSTTGVLSATLASMTALTDQRDGNVYTVARLADGNCWMTENLRLDADDTLGDTNKALAQGYKTWSGTGTNYGNFIGLADSEDANFKSIAPTAANNATNSIYSSDGSTTININSSGNPAYRIPRYNNNNTNQATNATNSAGTTLEDSYYNSNDHVRWYGYGNYYGWPAAMANTTYYSGPTATDADGYTSETVGTSLCPTGWQLPYGNSTGNGATTKGFSYLDTRMGGTGATADSSTTPTGADRSKMWRQFPNNFVYSGRFTTASAYDRSSYGYYWSSTAVNGYGSYDLCLYSSILNPGTDSYNKYLGLSIRCLASS